jgi:hypothetical protein
MGLANTGISGNFLTYPGQATKTILGNITTGTASPTALTPVQILGMMTTYAFVAGSNAATTGQSLADVTGLSVACVANAVYEIEANLTCSTTTVTTGNEYGIQFSQSGAAFEGQCKGSLTTVVDQSVRISALNTATVAFLTTSGQSGGILIKGILTTGANAGNVTVQHLKATSGTSTVFIGSYLKATRIS